MSSKMCDALGQAHEFILALKKAGVSDEMMQKVIVSKDNRLAEVIYVSLVDFIKDNVFELVCEKAITIPERGILLESIRNEFFDNAWHFDGRLLNYPDNCPTGEKVVAVYKALEKVPQEVVFEFIKKIGYFPGVLGLSAALFSKNLYFPTSTKVYGFEEKQRLHPAIMNTPTGYYYSLDALEGEKLSAGFSFLVVKDLPQSK